MNSARIDRLERRAFTDRYADGVIDLAVGLALAACGVVWLVAEDSAALAILAVPIVVMVAIPLRAKFVEARAGYVKFTPRRDRQQRALLLAMLSLGVATLALAIFGIGAARGEDVGDALAPGLLGIILAVPLAAAGLATRMHRVTAYGAVALAAAAATIAVGANPGWPLLATGVVAAACGAALLRRFLRLNPLPGAELG